MADSARANQTLSPAEVLARTYLTALQAKDKRAIMSILANDFVLEVPLNVPGTNDLSDSWRGLEAASANYDIAFREIADLTYVDIEITPGRDDKVAFLEARGLMRMANGRPYRNLYVFRFDVEDGKINRIREYTNPVTGALAFGIPLPQQASADFGDQFVTANPKP